MNKPLYYLTLAFLTGAIFGSMIVADTMFSGNILAVAMAAFIPVIVLIAAIVWEREASKKGPVGNSDVLEARLISK